MNLRAVNYAALFTMVFIVAITISAELANGFKQVLTNLTGHHWVSKSVLSILFFMIVYVLLSRIGEKLTARESYWTMSIAVIATLSILLFFVLHA